MATTEVSEEARLRLQVKLDASKTQAERNKLGQYATPTELALDILRYARSLLPSGTTIRFLDPAFGTGSFYSALLRTFPSAEIAEAVGYEIDPHYGERAAELWRETPLRLIVADFTRESPPPVDDARSNLLICNPPYVRHHHLTSDQKRRLGRAVALAAGVELGGLTGLYCYFLCLSHAWMADGGLAGWLIPSEFMDVNYGGPVKEYLLTKVTLLRVHRFDPDDVQFGDALVSSAVVWFRKAQPPENHAVEFTYGGTLGQPRVSRYVSADELRTAAKWTRFPLLGEAHNRTVEEPQGRARPRLGDLFTIKRGLATGSNEFFILTPEKIARRGLPASMFRPVLPSPRHLRTSEIEADALGNPVSIPSLFVLSCSLPEDEVRARYPTLWQYLQEGVANGVSARYLCRHRSPWYAQENRPAAPFLCTYMGRDGTSRSKPFRFILNHSRATALNVYLLLYPKPALAKALGTSRAIRRAVWRALEDIAPEVLLGEGRVYGGGLHKLEPRELANAPADSILAVLPDLAGQQVEQLRLLERAASADEYRTVRGLVAEEG